MTVRLGPDAIHLEGRCLVEDAEALILAMEGNPDLVVDIAAAQRLHMAVVQVLMALKPELRGPPSDPFLAQHVFERLISSDKLEKPA